MSGGVSPFEWIFPVVGASHVLYNASAQQVSPRAKLNAPDSKNVKQAALGDQAAAQQNQVRAERELASQRAAADLAARTETPAEADEARTRAGAVAQRLGLGGKRRASQTLTDPGMTLSGSY
jgi:hypothetical protein